MPKVSQCHWLTIELEEHMAQRYQSWSDHRGAVLPGTTYTIKFFYHLNGETTMNEKNKTPNPTRIIALISWSTHLYRKVSTSGSDSALRLTVYDFNKPTSRNSFFGIFNSSYMIRLNSENFSIFDFLIFGSQKSWESLLGWMLRVFPEYSIYSYEDHTYGEFRVF